jgi:hypothetical protein
MPCLPPSCGATRVFPHYGYILPLWGAAPGVYQPKITALKVLGWHDVSVLVRPSEVSTQGTSGGKRRYLPTY